MPYRKILTALILLFLVGFGLYLFTKSKSPKPITERIYTNETVTESNGTLVDGFPNVPIYPGMRIDKTYKKEQDGKTDYVAVWYFDGGDAKVPEMMKWYIDEYKKSGWTVTGPFIDEGQNELHIKTENSQYKTRVMSSKRLEEDEGGPGNIILFEALEK